MHNTGVSESLSTFDAIRSLLIAGLSGRVTVPTEQIDTFLDACKQALADLHPEDREEALEGYPQWESDLERFLADADDAARAAESVDRSLPWADALVTRYRAEELSALAGFHYELGAPTQWAVITRPDALDDLLGDEEGRSATELADAARQTAIDTQPAKDSPLYDSWAAAYRAIDHSRAMLTAAEDLRMGITTGSREAWLLAEMMSPEVDLTDESAECASCGGPTHTGSAPEAAPRYVPGDMFDDPDSFNGDEIETDI